MLFSEPRSEIRTVSAGESYNAPQKNKNHPANFPTPVPLGVER